MKPKSSFAAFFIACLLSTACYSQGDSLIKKNIVYAEAGSRKLLLDLYMPAVKKAPYLIVWVHGGAWRSGSKESPPLGILSAGYALASIDYRLSTEAPFPAMIHDIKAAIRFLRGNADKYGYHTDKIIIWGASSGGHIAALVGTTNNDSYYEGNLGNYTKESSSVQGIVDYYGPTNFLTILDQSTPHGIGVRAPALELFLGKPVKEVPELAQKASPVFQVDSTDPPLFIVHGDQDIQVPVNQSLELKAVYENRGLPVDIKFIHGAGHSDNIYYQQKVQAMLEKFLASVIKG